jgi:hypothetical protein
MKWSSDPHARHAAKRSASWRVISAELAALMRTVVHIHPRTSSRPCSRTRHSVSARSHDS